MIADPVARGRALAEFCGRLEPALWNDVLESGTLRGAELVTARAEWEVFVLYACVRGLVAAGGFGPENMLAMDALHDAVVTRWTAETDPPETIDERRERVAARYDEYGRIGQDEQVRGPEAVQRALGNAAARHLNGTDIADAELGIMAGELHDAVVQGATESVRSGGE